jgi:hypothetical protein
LLQLGIDFIRDSHNVKQQSTEVHAAQILLQSAKDAHLQDARFFDHHGSGVALLEPHLSMAVPALACQLLKYPHYTH